MPDNHDAVPHASQPQMRSTDPYFSACQFLHIPRDGIVTFLHTEVLLVLEPGGKEKTERRQADRISCDPNGALSFVDCL